MTVTKATEVNGSTMLPEMFAVLLKLTKCTGFTVIQDDPDKGVSSVHYEMSCEDFEKYHRYTSCVGRLSHSGMGAQSARMICAEIHPDGAAIKPKEVKDDVNACDTWPVYPWEKEEMCYEPQVCESSCSEKPVEVKRFKKVFDIIKAREKSFTGPVTKSCKKTRRKIWQTAHVGQERLP